MSNVHLIGQRAGGWLKDVKDKVQSVTPALPKLLPNAVVELTAPNRTGKRNAVYNVPANMYENLRSDDEERQFQKRNNNHCEYIQQTDATSAQMPASDSTCDDYNCHETTASESSQCSSETLTKPHVDDSSVSSVICDQIAVVSTESDAVHSNTFTELNIQTSTDNKVDCLHALNSDQASSCDGEQNLPPSEQSTQQSSDTNSQPVITRPPSEIRMFSARVSDSPEIIFSSSRKRTKPAKHGIYISHYYALIP